MTAGLSLLLVSLASALAGQTDYGDACADVILDSCDPDPATVVHQKQGISAVDCQTLATFFSSCTTFRHEQTDNTCTLLDTDYRPDNCNLYGGPAFRPDDDNLLEICFGVLMDEASTCDDILEEGCSMQSNPEGDIETGEIDNPATCSNLCAIENFPFFIFALEEKACQCFSSSTRSCTGVSGPPDPALDICTDDSGSTTEPKTTTTRPTGSATLVTGGWTSFNGNPELSNVTESSEVLGSSCSIPDLPTPLWAHITVITPDNMVLACGGFPSYILEPTSKCLELDSDANQWVDHSEPGYSAFASAVTLSDGVYMIGLGLVDQDPQTYSYLPEGSTEWFTNQLSADGTLAIVGVSCAVAISSSQFLVIGGVETENQVLQFDNIDKSWTVWAPLDERRVGHACAKLGNKIIISGGVDDDNLAIPTTTILNISTREERSGGDMVMARTGFGMTILNNKLVVFGGGDANVFGVTGDVTMMDSIEEWDDQSETWSLLEERMKTPRGGLGYTTGPASTFCG